MKKNKEMDKRLFPISSEIFKELILRVTEKSYIKEDPLPQVITKYFVLYKNRNPKDLPQCFGRLLYQFTQEEEEKNIGSY